MRRNSEMTKRLGALFNLIEAQIDDLFCFAITIQA